MFNYDSQHIYSNGHICLNILGDDWSPALTGNVIPFFTVISSCFPLCLPLCFPLCFLSVFFYLIINFFPLYFLLPVFFLCQLLCHLLYHLILSYLFFFNLFMFFFTSTSPWFQLYVSEFYFTTRFFSYSFFTLFCFYVTSCFHSFIPPLFPCSCTFSLLIIYS